MEKRMFKVYAECDDKIVLKVIPGHFATPQSHITHYIDMTTMKARASEASRIARALSRNYETSTPVDTIVCMDGLQVVGAYLAEELTKVGVLNMNAHQTIYVIEPEFNSIGQMIFRDNMQPMIKGKNVLLLNGSITTGETLSRAIESVLYYGGIIQGVAAVFSAVNKVAGMEIRSVFTQRDVPNYGTYKNSECPLCKRGEKIDAIVNSYGYSKL
ncbi:MAG TPA: phosphoribosyltransferase [Candidatus Blautia avistercoris]|uniref:phosphoribosyltransferase n=1 Tax=Blautia sp. An249 TaxID=1965603 RepID=UPI000B398FE0|nr:phosphoribosyltransferase [Blautia sp. An249]OUO77351.1 orotate phosphoribosyltransferase [Blautia sp. An249]HIY20174.1 phosphoribosyltransferase [Candidatus Blautia avistercoris]